MAGDPLPQARRWLGPILAAAGFLAGSTLSWLVLGLLWVEFDSLVPLWAGGCVVSVSAIALFVCVRAVESRATAAGMFTSAVVCTTFWTWLSSGPPFV